MFNLPRLIQRSLTHDARLHVGVAAGVALTCAIITGALGVGDSVRHTLRTTALQRLGNITHAITPGDRLFTDGLAEQLGPITEGEVSAILSLRGMVGRADGGGRAPDIQVVGYDDSASGLVGLPPHPPANNAYINTHLAHRLDVAVGDTLIVRIGDPRAIRSNLPIDSGDPATVLRVRIDRVLPDAEGGRFSLAAEQSAPQSIFLSRAWLAGLLGIDGRANIMLASSLPGAQSPALADGKDYHIPLELDDAELHFFGPTKDVRQLDTPRVFLDRSITEALDPLAERRVLTYLANTIAHGDRQTPYSMVMADDRLEGVRDGQIAINEWLADDLSASIGDTVTLSYYLPEAGAKLIEARASFEVVRIVPTKRPIEDRSLVPDFPGLKEVERISQWDAGPGIDRSRIRDKDEAYWDEHRATPKAFITLADGQRLWANQYGSLTAMQFQPTAYENILSRINPDALGFSPRDVRAQALRASGATVDFGVLFLSLSMFVIIAAGLLTGLLFAFGVEKRAAQIGTLRAIGFTPRKVRAWLVGEALVVAVIGAGVGLPLGVGYAAGLVALLSGGGWQGAVAGTGVVFHITPGSLVIGGMSAVLIALGAGAWTLRATMRQPARVLLCGGGSSVSEPSGRKAVVALFLAGGAVVCALALVIAAPAGTGPKVAGVFFGSGSLLLGAGLLAVFAWLARPGDVGHRGGRGGAEDAEQAKQIDSSAPRSPRLRALRDKTLSFSSLGLRNATRRRGRSLAGAGLIAAGLFIVAAVVGFAPSLPSDYAQRDSGTGGFALIGQTTLPITVDLNTAAGRDRFALEEDELPPGSVVPMRVSDGDDASCLNLNQTARPRVLGVDASLFKKRDAFTLSTDDGWAALDRSHDDGSIPALADANTAQWALHLAVGEVMTIERPGGEPIRLRLVGTIENSILQGGLVISEASFRAAFPAVEGYRLFLLDGIEPSELEERGAVLSGVMEDVGLSLEPTVDRLARFNAVQATYLTIFQALGALGVTLGCVGLGIVVLRNLLERRAELAMMLALGFSRGRLRRVVLIEHLGVLAAGLVIGAAAAGVALRPMWAEASASMWRPLGATLAACVLVTAVSVGWATRVALRGRLTEALRGE